MLYGPAISQSECRKVGPYQLSCNNMNYSFFKQLNKTRDQNFDHPAAIRVIMLQILNGMFKQVSQRINFKQALNALFINVFKTLGMLCLSILTICNFK